jgi:CBS domain-containing protein
MLVGVVPQVQEIMTPAHKLKMLTPEHSVLEAMEIMIHHNVRHVPVVSGLGGGGEERGAMAWWWRHRGYKDGVHMVCPW